MTGPNRLRNIDPDSLTFTLLIGALTALPSLATDMSLPALGGIAHSLHASPGETALTLSLFLAGYALAPIAFGPLSDEYGRRPVVIAGCALFALAAILGTLLLAAAVLGLAESAPRFSGRPHVPVRPITAYARVLRNRACLGYSLVNACAFGCLFGYINGSSLVMIEMLGVSPRIFGLLFALVDMGLLAGFFFNGRLNAWGVGRHAPLLTDCPCC